MRKFKPSGKDVAVFATGIVVGLAVAFWWPTAPPPSPLMKGLSSNWKAASSQFDARIRVRFPTGTPIRELTNELGAEGFKPTWFEANEEGCL